MKLRENSDITSSIQSLRQAKICNNVFKQLNEWEKYFTQYNCRYDANLLYPTSYVYDLTDTKTETKEEISLKIMNLGSQAYYDIQLSIRQL